MSRRNLRNRKPINYNKLNQGMDQSDSKMEEEVDLRTDIVAEKELCGSFEADEESNFKEDLKEDSDTEEGEVSSDSQEESEDEDPVLAQCVKERNIEKLKKILKKREEACKKLQKDLQKEKMKEKQEQEIRGIL